MDRGLPAHLRFSKAEQSLVWPLCTSPGTFLNLEPLWTGLEGPGPGTTEPYAFMHLFPQVPSSEEPALEDHRFLPSLCSGHLLPVEFSLPTLPLTMGPCANHFTELWRARAKGLSRSPTRLPDRRGDQSWQVTLWPQLGYLQRVGNKPHSPNFRMKTRTSLVCERAHYPIAPEDLTLGLHQNPLEGWENSEGWFSSLPSGFPIQ